MRGLHNPLHPDTRLALADCRRDGGKAIVLLNRRGWSNFLSCGSCGRVWMCPNCEVALVLHRAGGIRRLPSLRPPRAGAVELPRLRLGLGRAPRRRHRAPRARARHRARRRRASRCCGSMPTPPGSTPAPRSSSASMPRRAGVLIGTQMVAKGHDFADVGLGVVVDADQTLRFPDFRSEERTFALITQLAGRTGRGSSGAPPGVCSCRRWSRAARPIELAAAARLRDLRARRAAAPQGARLPAVRDPDPRDLRRDRRRRRARHGRRPPRPHRRRQRRA